MKYLFLLILFLTALAPNVFAHRFHTSLTRMDYNAEQKLVEITIQLFSHDLEAALEKQTGKRARLDKTPKIDEIIVKYLSDRFVFKNDKGEQKKLRWVGMEQKTDALWLYLETPMPEPMDGATLENRIFQELFNDQVNLVTTRYNGTKTDLVFKNGDKAQKLVGEKEN